MGAGQLSHIDSAPGPHDQNKRKYCYWAHFGLKEMNQTKFIYILCGLCLQIQRINTTSVTSNFSQVSQVTSNFGRTSSNLKSDPFSDIHCEQTIHFPQDKWNCQSSSFVTPFLPNFGVLKNVCCLI